MPLLMMMSIIHTKMSLPAMSNVRKDESNISKEQQKYVVDEICNIIININMKVYTWRRDNNQPHLLTSS